MFTKLIFVLAALVCDPTKLASTYTAVFSHLQPVVITGHCCHCTDQYLQLSGAVINDLALALSAGESKVLVPPGCTFGETMEGSVGELEMASSWASSLKIEFHFYQLLAQLRAAGAVHAQIHS